MLTQAMSLKCKPSEGNRPFMKATVVLDYNLNC